MGKNKNLGFFMIELIPKIIEFNLFKKFGFPKILPIFLTLSVNDWCNSRCKTCNIWKNNAQTKIAEQLKIGEYEKIIQNFNSLSWITITGGEPFLRDDLPDIVKIVYEKTKPRYITIATNATVPKRIVENTKRILETCQELKLNVNISIDEIENKHDEIRGYKGNYALAMRTFKSLKELGSNHLFVGFNTVISSFNVSNFANIYEQLAQLNPDSYICEIAEKRAKLYNLDLRVMPTDNEYEKTLKFLISILTDSKRKDVPEIVRKLRIEFYKYLINNKKIDNFEGIASAYIMSNGELWLSYSKRFVAGNLRDVNYDFKKLWFNEKASQFRKIMNSDRYSTSLANAFYTNFMCNPKMLLKTIFKLNCFSHTILIKPKEHQS